MLKSNFAAALLAALASQMNGPGNFITLRAPSAPPRRSGKRYPEQSSRQAMRGHRRAQGGPGIELVDGQYMRRV